MADKIRNVEVRDVEADEVWAYIGKKEKRVRPEDDQNLGDSYTFVAIERHSKLVLNIAISSFENCQIILAGPAQRTATFLGGFGSPTYNDIFNATLPHVTMFCYELADIPADPAVPTQIQLTWNSCKRHNCADDECKDEPYGAPPKIW